MNIQSGGYEHCSCEECGYYKGCNDCGLYGTELCDNMNKRGNNMCKFFDVCVVKECVTCELGDKILKVKYISSTVSPITISDNGDWIDLRVTEDIMMKRGDFKLLPLGVAIELPKGYEALVVPRSSTFKNYHIIQTNSIGIIDESYCGDNDEWKFPAYCMENTFIPKNTRICQFRIVKHQPSIRITPVRKLNNKDRNGFGSTGTL